MSDKALKEPLGIATFVGVDGRQKVKSRFYFFLAAPPLTGGDLIIVEHAKTLIKAGVDARFLFLPNESRATPVSDFPPEVPLELLTPDIILSEHDFLVVGESQGPVYRDLTHWLVDSPKYAGFVMLNQAIHWMPFAFKSPDHINNMKMTGLIINSPWIIDHMKSIFKMKVEDIFTTIEYVAPVTELPQDIASQPNSLTRTDLEQKPTCQISYIYNPRKRPYEFSFLRFAFLSLYPEYKDKVVFNKIERKTHHEVLQIMQNSDVFITSGYMDSHNLQAIEAMAGGCHVVGYTGITGNVDHFNDENGWWFKEEGNLRKNLRIIKEAVDLYYANDEASKNKRKSIIKNGMQMASKFRRNSEITQIVRAYQNIWTNRLKNRQHTKNYDVVFSGTDKVVYHGVTDLD